MRKPTPVSLCLLACIALGALVGATSLAIAAALVGGLVVGEVLWQLRPMYSYLFTGKATVGYVLGLLVVTAALSPALISIVSLFVSSK